MKATTAAAWTNCTAVVLTERSAGFVSFRQLHASRPPCKNVNSAVASLLPAAQFSGNHAICAVTTATFATF
jgi:hypothetical protein